MPYLTPDSIPANFQCGALQIPDNVLIIAAVSGALYDLTQEKNWEQFGAITPAEMAAAMSVMYEAFMASSCEDDVPTQITITPATVFPVLLKSVVAGETADELLVIVDEAFDADLVLSVGDSGDNARLMTIQQNNLQVVGGQYQVSPEYQYPGAADIYVYLTGGTPTVGSARIRLYSFVEA